MFFVYKTILDTTETGSVLKDKLFNLLEGLADTSMYSANPMVNIDMLQSIPADNQPGSGSCSGSGILKKNVRIDETNNKVFPIDPVSAPTPTQNKPQQPEPEPEINKELAQLAEEFQLAPAMQPTISVTSLPPPVDTKPVKPTQSPFPAPLETRKQKSAAFESGKSINVDSEYSNRMKEYGTGTDKSQLIVHHNDAQNLDFRNGSGVDKSAPHGSVPGSPIASTSISEIQKMRMAANSTNDILQNRDQLSNEDIEKIKLNYDPNDVLKLYGYGNMSDLQQSAASQSQSQLNQHNRMESENDDMQSIVSGASDIGSAFDIDLSEFESAL